MKTIYIEVLNILNATRRNIVAERRQSANDEVEDRIKQIAEIADTLDYPELLRLRDMMQAKYEAKADAAREKVIEETKIKFAQLGLTFEDVITSQRKRKAAVRKPAVAKYRSPDGTKDWNGRGAKPKWIREHEEAGGNRDDFLIT